jgi:hypothetical protein
MIQTWEKSREEHRQSIASYKPFPQSKTKPQQKYTVRMPDRKPLQDQPKKVTKQ